MYLIETTRDLTCEADTIDVVTGQLARHLADVAPAGPIQWSVSTLTVTYHGFIAAGASAAALSDFLDRLTGTLTRETACAKLQHLTNTSSRPTGEHQ